MSLSIPSLRVFPCHYSFPVQIFPFACSLSCYVFSMFSSCPCYCPYPVHVFSLFSSAQCRQFSEIVSSRHRQRDNARRVATRPQFLRLSTLSDCRGVAKLAAIALLCLKKITTTYCTVKRLLRCSVSDTKNTVSHSYYYILG